MKKISCTYFNSPTETFTPISSLNSLTRVCAFVFPKVIQFDESLFNKLIQKMLVTHDGFVVFILGNGKEIKIAYFEIIVGTPLKFFC